jgi:uncharacterized membrane protein
MRAGWSSRLSFSISLPGGSKMKIKTIHITLAAVIAAAYVVLTLPFAQFAFGGPFQFRLSEALTVLPALTPAAIPGLFLGCLLANMLNPQNLGPIDIIGGSLATLLAAWLTWLIKRKLSDRGDLRLRRWANPLALVPPVLVNALVVGLYLPYLLSEPGVTPDVSLIGLFMGSIAVSEAGVIYLIGFPLLIGLQKARLKFLQP